MLGLLRLICGIVALDRQVSEEEIEAAERELLDAKASYSLRNNIIESILVADPVLKAVHAGVNAAPVERYVYACYLVCRSWTDKIKGSITTHKSTRRRDRVFNGQLQRTEWAARGIDEDRGRTHWRCREEQGADGHAHGAY